MTITVLDSLFCSVNHNIIKCVSYAMLLYYNCQIPYPLRPLRGHLPQSGRHSESDASHYN